MRTLHFDSLSACVDDTRRPFNRATNTRRFNSTVVNRRDDSSWFGVEGGSPAVANMVEFTGYPEGGRMISAMSDSLQATLPPALGIRRKKRRADSGDEYDIHSAMRGAHDRAWTQSHRELRHGLGVVRIIVDICGDAAKRANALQWRGVAGITLCTMLRQAGYSVEIVAALGVINAFKQETLLWTCIVNSRHGSVDIDSLAAVLALPGFFRTYGFAGIIRAADNFKSDAADGLGYPVPVSNIYEPRGDCIELIVPNEVLDEDKARDWINESIALLQGDTA
ncbi:MAG: hypothetical protein ABFC77_15540 [Thermoguttaceae bacterium]